MKPVKIANTDGMVASLADGARVGDRVALNLPDGVSDGGRIRPIESPLKHCDEWLMTRSIRSRSTRAFA